MLLGSRKRVPGSTIGVWVKLSNYPRDGHPKICRYISIVSYWFQSLEPGLRHPAAPQQGRLLWIFQCHAECLGSRTMGAWGMATGWPHGRLASWSTGRWWFNAWICMVHIILAWKKRSLKRVLICAVLARWHHAMASLSLFPIGRWMQLEQPPPTWRINI